MKISTCDGSILFTCDYCQVGEIVPAQKTKRGFMARLNKFARHHDNNCKFTFERKKAFDASKVATDEILGRFLSAKHDVLS